MTPSEDLVTSVLRTILPGLNKPTLNTWTKLSDQGDWERIRSPQVQELVRQTANAHLDRSLRDFSPLPNSFYRYLYDRLAAVAFNPRIRSETLAELMAEPGSVIDRD